MKKFLSMAISILLITTMIVGCNEKTESNESKSTYSHENSQSDSKEQGQLPIVKEKITLKMLAATYSAHGEWSEMTLMKKLEELTNIHMDITAIPDAQIQEKKNLAFASGDLPDIFFRANLTTFEEDAYGMEGSLIPLNDLINKYAPNIKKAFLEIPDAKKAITTQNGKIFALPYLFDSVSAPNLQYINTKWLENIGKKMPENVDELYIVLKAFKDKDANQNGQNDEIPFTDQNFTNTTFLILPAFGIISKDGRWAQKDGKAIYAPMQDNYKEYLMYMKKLYAEGLYDQEILQNNLDKVKTKLKQSRVGVMPDLLYHLNPEDVQKYSALPPLTSSVNNQKLRWKVQNIRTGTYAITNKNKYPEASIKWVDMFYAYDPSKVPQGAITSFNCSNGLEGEDWEFIDKEKTTYRITPPKNTDLAFSMYKMKYVTPFTAGGAPNYLKVIDNIKSETPLSSADIIKVNGSKNYYLPYMKDGFPLNTRFDKEENTRVYQLNTEIEKYVKQMESKFLIGEEPFENWNVYIETLRKMGIDELIKLQQTALDRWNKN